MNKILENILARRSCRAFDPEKKVPEELLNDILTAALNAPTGRNRQQTIFVAVTDPEKLKWLSAINCRIGGWPQDFDPFYKAPAVVIVLGPKSVSTTVYDGALAMGNMMLAATSLGLGSCWIHRAKETFELPEGKDFLKSLGIEGDYEGIGHCALGYALKEPPAKKILDNRVFLVK